MTRINSHDVKICFRAFQAALDALDVVGHWEWDAASDRMRSDAVVAMLYNVDPQQAESGVPIAVFQAAIHNDDHDKIRAVVRNGTWNGRPYLVEYRLTSVDGRTRWVLARGRFFNDEQGRPLGGNGVIIDITDLRSIEHAISSPEWDLAESALDRAAEHAIAAREAIDELQDETLKVRANALLLELGCRLAQHELRNRHRRLN